MRAAVVLQIPGLEFDEEQKPRSEKFKLHISEKGAKFNEDIEIDEEKDIEYFKVPPHNELSETDNMYDFKMVRNNIIYLAALIISKALGSFKASLWDMDFPLCDNIFPPCMPDRWLYTCRIRTSRCVYYVTCRVDAQQKVLSCASVAQHLYHGLVCCKPRCS